MVVRQPDVAGSVRLQRPFPVAAAPRRCRSELSRYCSGFPARTKRHHAARAAADNLHSLVPLVFRRLFFYFSIIENGGFAKRKIAQYRVGLHFFPRA